MGSLDILNELNWSEFVIMEGYVDTTNDVLT